VFPIEKGGSLADLQACRDGSPECKVIATATNKAITPQEINPNFNRPTVYQAPRSIRLGAKLSF
jgi:hypothetical protein